MSLIITFHPRPRSANTTESSTLYALALLRPRIILENKTESFLFCPSPDKQTPENRSPAPLRPLLRIEGLSPLRKNAPAEEPFRCAGALFHNFFLYA